VNSLLHKEMLLKLKIGIEPWLIDINDSQKKALIDKSIRAHNQSKKSD